MGTPDTGMIEDLWRGLLEAVNVKTPMQQALFFGVGFAALLEAIFVSYNLLLYYAHTHKWWAKYKIHPNVAYPEKALIRECLWEHFINAVCLRWIFLSLLHPVFTYVGAASTDPALLPTPIQLVCQLALCVLPDDTWFYWAHRLCHSKWLYAKIHKKHHRFKIPIGICSEFCHPLEDIFVNTASTAIGPLLLQAHCSVWWIYGCCKMWQTIESHSGYVFPFPFSPWSIGHSMEDGRHEFHHSHNVGNFGGMFCFWDVLMATDRAYEDWLSQRKKLGAVKTIPAPCRAPQGGQPF